jgi:hypothetical protein
MKTLEAMNLVGQIDGGSTLKRMQDKDPLIRYWGLIALECAGLNSSLLIQELETLLDDPSPINAIQSAKMLIQFKEDPKAYQTLAKYLQAEEETTVLHAAIALRLLEEKAKPLIPLVKDEIYPKYAGEVWGRYKSWSYPMFIGMALDQARINCGEEIQVRN